MPINQEQQEFIKQRQKLMAVWPWLGGLLVLALFLLLIFFYLYYPILVNPWAVMRGIESEQLSPSILVLMATMLPCSILFCFTIILTFLGFIFMAQAKEKQWLEIVDLYRE